MSIYARSHPSIPGPSIPICSCVLKAREHKMAAARPCGALFKNQKLSAGHLTGGVDQISSLLPTGNLSKMPSLCHFVLPLCSNRKNNCKFGLFHGDNGQYEKRRLCGHPSDLRGGCKAESELCKRLSFHRLPRNEDLRRRWIAAENTHNH